MSTDDKKDAPAANGNGKRNNYLQHVVLFKLKKSATPEAIENFVDALRSLKTIPGVTRCKVGTYIKPSEMYDKYKDRRNGYTHILIIRVRDVEALQAYMDHPEHLRVVKEFVDPIKDGDALAFDYYGGKPSSWVDALTYVGVTALGVAVGFALKTFLSERNK